MQCNACELTQRMCILDLRQTNDGGNQLPGTNHHYALPKGQCQRTRTRPRTASRSTQSRKATWRTYSTTYYAPRTPAYTKVKAAQAKASRSLRASVHAPITPLPCGAQPSTPSKRYLLDAELHLILPPHWRFSLTLVHKPPIRAAYA